MGSASCVALSLLSLLFYVHIHATVALPEGFEKDLDSHIAALGKQVDDHAKPQRQDVATESSRHDNSYDKSGPDGLGALESQPVTEEDTTANECPTFDIGVYLTKCSHVDDITTRMRAMLCDHDWSPRVHAALATSFFPSCESRCLFDVTSPDEAAYLFDAVNGCWQPVNSDQCDDDIAESALEELVSRSNNFCQDVEALIEHIVPPKNPEDDAVPSSPEHLSSTADHLDTSARDDDTVTYTVKLQGMQALGLSLAGGADQDTPLHVTGLLPGSPLMSAEADGRKLQRFDRIVRVNDVQVTDMHHRDAVAAIRRALHAQSDQVTVVVRPGSRRPNEDERSLAPDSGGLETVQSTKASGKTLSTSRTTKPQQQPEQTADSSAARRVEINVPLSGRRSLGLEIAGGSDTAEALHIIRIVAKSPAAVARPSLQPGDVIVAVGGKDIQTMTHASAVETLKAKAAQAADAADDSQRQLILLVLRTTPATVSSTTRNSADSHEVAAFDRERADTNSGVPETVRLRGQDVPNPPSSSEVAPPSPVPYKDNLESQQVLSGEELRTFSFDDLDPDDEAAKDDISEALPSSHDEANDVDQPERLSSLDAWADVFDNEDSSESSAIADGHLSASEHNHAATLQNHNAATDGDTDEPADPQEDLEGVFAAAVDLEISRPESHQDGSSQYDNESPPYSEEESAGLSHEPYDTRDLESSQPEIMDNPRQTDMEQTPFQETLHNPSQEDSRLDGFGRGRANNEPGDPNSNGDSAVKKDLLRHSFTTSTTPAGQVARRLEDIQKLVRGGDSFKDWNQGGSSMSARRSWDTQNAYGQDDDVPDATPSSMWLLLTGVCVVLILVIARRVPHLLRCCVAPSSPGRRRGPQRRQHHLHAV